MFSMAYGDQGIFVTRPLFDEIAGFREIPLMEDFHFSGEVRKKRCRYHLLDGPLHVSARRWDQRGPIRQTFSNWVTVVRYLSGVSPEQLAAEYDGRKPGKSV